MRPTPAIAIVLLAAAGFVRGANPAAPQPLTAQIRLEKVKLRPTVLLMGRTADGRMVCRDLKPPGTVWRLKPAEVSRIRFDFKYDRALVAKLRRSGRWTQAAMVMGKAVIPALPSLDIPHNNGIGLAMRTGNYLTRGGDLKSGFSLAPAARKAGAAEFKYALAIFQKVAAAEWSERAAEAQMRACMCLVFLGRTEEAEETFEAIAEPEVDGDEYGVYQLARAYCWAAKAKAREAADEKRAAEWRLAVEAAVHSSDFASKDINTFPSALLLTAQCYEELGDWYRARDVYYGLAKLFARTPWGVVARRGLRRILDDGKTAKDEAVASRDVFFGIDEDLNAESRKLLGIDENGNPVVPPKDPKPADKKN